MDVVRIVAAGAMLVMFSAVVVVALIRKAPLTVVLTVVGVLMFGVLALAQQSPELLRAAAEFLTGAFG